MTSPKPPALATPSRPNILWFCSDQQRYDTIRALGNEFIRTPQLDALVRSGVAFDRCYVQNPICTPSRASFLTGRYPRAHGVHSNGNDHFPASEKLVTRILADTDYVCGLIGKLHLSGAQHGTEVRADDGYSFFQWSNMPRPEDGSSYNNAYHHWLRAKGVDPQKLFDPIDTLIGAGVPAELHQCTWTAESASSFITANQGRPWMLSVNPFAPHHPFDPSPEYMRRYDPQTLPDPLYCDDDFERQKLFGNIQHQTFFPVDPRIHHPRGADPQRFPDGQFIKHNGVPRAYYGRAFKAAYYAMIEQLDDALARIVDALRSSGQLDNTIIIYTSDHGEGLGDHGLLLKGARFFEGSVRVPLIMSWPAGYMAGIRSPALVESIDIAPTLLEAAGIAIPPSMQGRSLHGILTGRSDAHHHKDMVFCEFMDSMSRLYSADRTRATMTFDGHHKLVSYHGHNLFELFDLKADPDEFHNLWDTPQYRDQRWDIFRAQVDGLAANVMPSVPRTKLF